jgi:peptide/nickel transport system ATP-binding protein
MIELRNVRAGYQTRHGFVAAVDDVSLAVADNEVLGIAGESGCGKTTLVKVLYGEFTGALRMEAGSVKATFRKGGSEQGPEQVVLRDGAKLSDLWWDAVAYVPQGSMSVLNPVMRIESQILDALPRRAREGGRNAVRERLVAFLAELGLPASVLHAYPHQLSGGMRQRVLVAIAAFPNPGLILADEPTTALDVIVQKKILLMMSAIQRRQRNSLVIVSHDLGVHYQITDRIAIAYAGKLVELGPTEAVFHRPSHPYTRALIEAIPQITDHGPRAGLEGRPPDLAAPPVGCRFSDRCPEVQEICRRVSPDLLEKTQGRQVACHMR